MKPRLVDPAIIRRTFATTPSKLCVLTTDGLVYDNVHYRFNERGIKKTLSSNLRRMPFADRLKGNAKLYVSIRCWDDDIDMIEVVDDANGEFHQMWSTDPGYTGGLTRWEHHVYQGMLRKGGGGATTKRDMLRGKARHLDHMHRTLTGKRFREREQDVGMLEAEELRLSGARGFDPGCARTPELGIPTNVGGEDRLDRATPPPQGKEPDTPDGQEVDDVRSDPNPQIAEETGQPEIDEDPMKRSRWDVDDVDGDDDEED